MASIRCRRSGGVVWVRSFSLFFFPVGSFFAETIFLRAADHPVFSGGRGTNPNANSRYYVVRSDSSEGFSTYVPPQMHTTAPSHRPVSASTNVCNTCTSYLILSYLILKLIKIPQFLKGSDGSCVWGALIFGSDLFPPSSVLSLSSPCLTAEVTSSEGSMWASMA